jgi:hypothetical protein
VRDEEEGSIGGRGGLGKELTGVREGKGRAMDDVMGKVVEDRRLRDTLAFA